MSIKKGQLHNALPHELSFFTIQPGGEHDKRGNGFNNQEVRHEITFNRQRAERTNGVQPHVQHEYWAHRTC